MVEPEPKIENAKLALETLTANYREISEINKRTGDRTTIVLGATVTAFGLIVKLSDGPLSGWSLFFLCTAIVCLAGCFFFAVATLFPKKGEQPGVTDVDGIWKEYVCVTRESAYANTMSDLCRVLRLRRETGKKMARMFKWTIVFGALSLICASCSELISANTFAAPPTADCQENQQSN